MKCYETSLKREMDKQRPGHLLPDVRFALVQPTQCSVLRSGRAGVTEQRAAIHSNVSAATDNCTNKRLIRNNSDRHEINFFGTINMHGCTGSIKSTNTTVRCMV